MRPALIVALMLTGSACGSPPAGAEPAAAGTSAQAPRPLRGLRQTARWARLAVPVAFTHDGRHWMGAVDRELVEYDGEREVRRLPVMVAGVGAKLAPLPGGRWLAGAAIVDRAGEPEFSGYQWAQRYGRFGSPKAFAVSADGTVAIVDGADSPSRCLCDRDRGTAGSSDGALVRLALIEGAVRERVLREHHGAEYHVAASATAVAAMDGLTLSVWPATGDGPPVTVELPAPTLGTLAWASDRYLVGTRYIDVERTDVVVLDRDAGYAPVWTWPVAGSIEDLAIRPGGAELAIATTRYRATDRVYVDERRVAVFTLDGTRRAQVDTVGYPASVAWSPRGDALLVATTGNSDAERAVLRFAAR